MFSRSCVSGVRHDAGVNADADEVSVIATRLAGISGVRAGTAPTGTFLPGRPSRQKIPPCHAVSRPKISLFMASGPANE
jgi:hypothetical protein